ncbi:alpha/beta fold hydrolase [Actinomycetota bacterium]
MTPDAACVLVDGPWKHRFVAANGARFHVAEVGEGPLVLFLHGFPQFWWAWRHQLVAVAEAGFRAVALDLRGFGASDKPPRGYDTTTSVRDVTSVIRSLGADEAVVVGHGAGAWTAWTMPYLAPELTCAIASMSMAHPRAFRQSWLRDAGQAKANSYLLGLQRPFVPEREMTRDSGYVSRVLREWSSPTGIWPSVEEAARYAEAAALPFVAHSAAEYFRWMGRSMLRPDGWRFSSRVSEPVSVPVLRLHGADDPVVLPRTEARSAAYLSGPNRHHVVAHAGHFLPEEAPEEVSEHLVRWLDEVAYTP